MAHLIASHLRLGDQLTAPVTHETHTDSSEHAPLSVEHPPRHTKRVPMDAAALVRTAEQSTGTLLAARERSCAATATFRVPRTTLASPMADVAERRTTAWAPGWAQRLAGAVIWL